MEDLAPKIIGWTLHILTIGKWTLELSNEDGKLKLELWKRGGK